MCKAGLISVERKEGRRGLFSNSIRYAMAKETWCSLTRFDIFGVRSGGGQDGVGEYVVSYE